MSEKNLRKAAENFIVAIDTQQSDQVIADRRSRYETATSMVNAHDPTWDVADRILIEVIASKATSARSVRTLASEMTEKGRSRFLDSLPALSFSVDDIVADPALRESAADFGLELERASAAAVALANEYIRVYLLDGGEFVRDERELPADKAMIRHAIICLACTMDAAPNADEVGQLLVKSWVALEFFGNSMESGERGSECQPAYGLSHRIDCAGNADAVSCLSSLADAESSLGGIRSVPTEASTTWIEGVVADYRERLSSLESRTSSIRAFADGSIPGSYFDGIIRSDGFGEAR